MKQLLAFFSLVLVMEGCYMQKLPPLGSPSYSGMMKGIPNVLPPLKGIQPWKPPTAYKPRVVTTTLAKKRVTTTIAKKRMSTKQKRDEIMRRMRNVNSIGDLLKTFAARKGLYMKAILGPDKVGPKGPCGSILPVKKKNSWYITVRDDDVSHRLGTKTLPFAEEGGCEPTPKPRDISYLSYEHGGVIYPACITYNQCGGCCTHNYMHECAPLTYKSVSVNLFVISYENYAMRYIPYTYNEHTSCGCQCKTRKEHCTSTQTYDPYNCQCNCLKSPLTVCQNHKQWSSTDCDCVCKSPDTSCNLDKIWNENTCSCVCKAKYNLCKVGQSWDAATCRCLNNFLMRTVDV